MRLPKRRSLKPAPRPSPPPLLRERGPDAATRPRGPWAHLASFTCRVPPVGNFHETRLLAPPRGQCAVGGRARGPLRAAARSARVHVCEAAEKRARQELKARRQKAAGRPRLFHAPSLFPMKLCLASPFKFPPPFETHLGCGRRHPSVAARAAAFASAPSTRGAPRAAAPFAVGARALGGEKEPPTARRAARRPSELPRAWGQVSGAPGHQMSSNRSRLGPHVHVTRISLPAA